MKSGMHFLGFLAVAAVLVSVPAGGALAGKYGMGGCGVGAMLFGPGGRFEQDIKDVRAREVLAATTNGSASNTFAITTGTSDCTQNGVALKDKEQEIFAEVNLEPLSRDMASGSGEYLSAFGALMGCGTEAQPRLGKVSQENYERIFPGEETLPQDVVIRVQDLIQKDAELSASCTGV